MKLKFHPSLEYQQDAIKAVVDVFAGQPIAHSNFEISATAADTIELSDFGISNKLILTDEQFLFNVHKVQESNGIEKTPTLQGRHFSIEMETGTGKTYVYLRSIFELSKQYGFRKFIIVVPSVAIREGVLKSISIMEEHFRTLYDKAPFNYFVYDSKKLGRVRQFATSSQIQIMVINIQSFSKDVADKETSDMTHAELKKLNVINRENDRISGYKPIRFIQDTNPIVIIDEPQSVDTTPKAQRAIANLTPLATLRYSATHRDSYNLLYKLDPVRAYDLRLVKRIEVASVRSDKNFNDAYVKLIGVDNKKGIRAQIKIHQRKNGNIKPANLWVKVNDDLYIKSGKREYYRHGYDVRGIDCTPDMEYIEFNSGKRLRLGDEIGGISDEVMKAQVRETIEQHLKKEYDLRKSGIKVLSLFFIDRVENYRTYHNGTTGLGKIGRWFEESYQELSAQPIYAEFAVDDVSNIHGGYFSKDGNRVKNTTGKSAADANTYNIIMRDKEQLLDPECPLRFIFSHSALREGWDNPNVFQICTLNQSHSAEKKRQEIGRGLRLPVNRNGDRIHDEDVNRLTIIANEFYEDFAQSLQAELEEDFGIKFECIGRIAFAKITRTGDDGTETAIGQGESIRIWKSLVHNGYLNENGDLLALFNPGHPDFTLDVDTAYADITSEIIDVMQHFVFKNRVVDVRGRRKITLNRQVYLSPEFKSLWDKIKYRTRCRVAFDTKDLIRNAANLLKEMENIRPVRITTTRVGIDMTDAGVSTTGMLEERSHEVNGVKALPDILAYLQKETKLTRHTLAMILKGSGRISEFKINPQQFMTLVAREISRSLRKLIITGIQYEKVDNHYWEMKRIEEEAEQGIVRYLRNIYEVRDRKNSNKSLFDAVPIDSEVERRFANDLDNHENIRLFVKLPGWFRIDTPIGPYNPDWAFVTERDEKLYFVRETKGSRDKDTLRIQEERKTYCGQRHFEAIGVDYDVVTKLSEVDF